MHSDRALLGNIRDNIRLALSFVAGLSAEQFYANIEKIYAVTRCLEIISEASRRLSPELKQRQPDLPWAEIASAGNIYRHEYERVDAAIIWRTVRNALPPLLAVVEAELAARS